MLFMDDGSGEGDEAPRALVVMAHPDDAEIGCMGTMLALRARGWEVHLLIVATGEHGVSVDDRDAGQGSFHESLRYQESLRAFAGTGVVIESLMRVDGALQVSRELISDIERKLRAFEPRVVITHYADGSGMDHQDHAAVARGASQQLLMDVQVAPDTGWRRKLSRKLDFHIRDKTLRDEVARAYDSPELCTINLRSVALLAERLGVHTPTVRSSALEVGGSKTARVVNLCLAVGATTYLSGPGARGYLDAEAFAEAGLSLRFFAPEVPDHLSALAHV